MATKIKDPWAALRPSGLAWRPNLGFSYKPPAPKPPPAPPAPSMPALTAPASTAPSSAPAMSPLVDDAQAAAARAQALFDRTQQVAGLQQQGSYDTTDLAEALRRMEAQRPRDEQTTRETANRQGLFYSGQLGKRLGDLETSYTQREADQRTAFARRDAARQAALDAIAQGAPLSDAAITAAELDRQLARDTATAADGGLAPPVQSDSSDADRLAAMQAAARAQALANAAKQKNKPKKR